MISNIVATQIAIHMKYGGVFPEVASRQHVRTIYAVFGSGTGTGSYEPGGYRCHRGHARAGSGRVFGGGAECRQGAGIWRGLPLIGINHLEGHIYSAWVYPQDTPNPPPAPVFSDPGAAGSVVIQN